MRLRQSPDRGFVTETSTKLSGMSSAITINLGYCCIDTTRFRNTENVLVLSAAHVIGCFEWLRTVSQPAFESLPFTSTFGFGVKQVSFINTLTILREHGRYF